MVLDCLIRDPTLSLKRMTEELGVYRQKIWRRKNHLEDNNVIWGYTAVVDEEKLDRETYMMLIKMKPLCKDLVDTTVDRLRNWDYKKIGVRIINVFMINSEYDWLMMFSAPDRSTARKYLDLVRNVYSEHLLEKPALIGVDFSLVREGKLNPELERLSGFISSTGDDD